MRAKYALVRDALQPLDIKVFAGAKSIEQAVTMEGIDTVLTAMVGYAGLRPTMAAINAGKSIALANKETLVVAGELITTLAREKAVNIYPVDSEHSAIFQCLAGEWENPIEKIVLTASGGPFRGRTRTELATVTRCPGAEASQLGHGRQDHHRQCEPDEQGAGGHRGEMALPPEG